MECPHCHRQTSLHSPTCRSCGKHIPPGQYLLEESGIIAPASSKTSPQPKVRRELPVPSSDSRTRVASLGDRLVAFALDCGFIFGVFAVIDAWTFMRWGIVDGTELKLTVASLLVAQFLNAVVFFLYFWLLEAGFGTTLGKAMVGIRVVQTSERHPLAAFAIRNSLRVVDGLGFYLVGVVVAGCSRVHRRLGDICAGTVVIEEPFGYGVKAVAVLLWIAVLAAAVWSVPQICTTNVARPSPYLNRVVIQVGRSGKSTYFKFAGLHVDVALASTPAR
jgi:uncharacterized RDD family membrane protein YckC